MVFDGLTRLTSERDKNLRHIRQIREVVIGQRNWKFRVKSEQFHNTSRLEKAGIEVKQSTSQYKQRRANITGSTDLN